LIFKDSKTEIEEYIIKHHSENKPIQPIILICGTSDKPKVLFDCIKFKLFSISSAIDVCYKMFHIFNLDYPLQSLIVPMALYTKVFLSV